MQPITLPALIHFASAALGVLLVLLLLSRREGNPAANRWLAAFVGCLALLWTGDLLEETRTVLAWPWTSHSTDWLIFLIGPCLWMYVRRLTRTQTPSFRVWLVHTVPAVLVLALLVPFYRLPAATKVEVIARELAEPNDSLNVPLLGAVVQSMGYWIASLAHVRRYHAALRERYSSLAQRNLSWLHTMLSVTLAMWVVWAIAIVFHAPRSQWLGHVAVPGGLYLLAFLGLRQPAPFTDGSEAGASPSSSNRYARSGLDRELVPQLLARLDAVMRSEKPWLESDLALANLAARCDLSPHNLSQLLNQELGTNFFDYINSRRVEEVKRCLLDPAYDEQTILQIALASGFSSKTSFNTAFRQHTRTTPSEFRRGAGCRAGAQST